ncbi:WYL domain-containing protein [Streptomyces sp. NBC_00243]|uniref:helix-turn-helix transcriptional regulator n=1 Tax=Streptomyces sp. NBC_00243 TaxID=2975688 RepID=UPI002DDAF673|nr:WYL domain-containing protein [Streptomyces sp. NBC_00243]WRZ19689.1 WYL domain-containing protein [Streptomyces sp. NBC_00243]
MTHDESPTARTLLLLEMVQSSPGVTASRLAERLGVSERAVRRYVGILREAGVPVESARGPHGGYRVGRGLRLPPLMFTTAEALGLVMAVLDGHRDAADPADPVGSALGKIMRVLPESVAGPAQAVRKVSALVPDPDAASPAPDTTAALVQACASQRRLRLGYRTGPDREERAMEVDPWAVVVRHGRWYLLCWSHTKNARRALRVDRVTAVDVLAETHETYAPPPSLNPAEALEAHLAEGWAYEVEVIIDAPADTVAQWIPRSLGRPEPIDADRTRLLATTDEPDWYADQLTAIKAPFRIVKPRELREAARTLGRRLLDADRER